jgi:hypothetical protein
VGASLHLGLAEVTDAAAGTATPLPLPRTLATPRAVKRELISLYRQGKAGRVEPILLGKLAHILNSLTAMHRDIEIDQRLAALERRLDGELDHPAQPNGQAPLGDRSWS